MYLLKLTQDLFCLDLKKMTEKKEFFGSKCLPEYAADYFSKPWCERDLMGYFDYLDYMHMSKEPTKYFCKKVINFNIIYHESRGVPLEG